MHESDMMHSLTVLRRIINTIIASPAVLQAAGCLHEQLASCMQFLGISINQGAQSTNLSINQSFIHSAKTLDDIPLRSIKAALFAARKKAKLSKAKQSKAKQSNPTQPPDRSSFLSWRTQCNACQPRNLLGWQAIDCCLAWRSSTPLPTSSRAKLTDSAKAAISRGLMERATSYTRKKCALPLKKARLAKPS